MKLPSEPGKYVTTDPDLEIYYVLDPPRTGAKSNPSYYLVNTSSEVKLVKFKFEERSIGPESYILIPRSRRTENSIQTRDASGEKDLSLGPRKSTSASHPKTHSSAAKREQNLQNQGVITTGKTSSTQKQTESKLQQQIISLQNRVNEIDRELVEPAITEIERIEQNCLAAGKEVLEKRTAEVVGDILTTSINSTKQILEILTEAEEEVIRVIEIEIPVIGKVKDVLSKVIHLSKLAEYQFSLPEVPTPVEFDQDFAETLAGILLSEEPPETFPTYIESIKSLYWDALLDYKDALQKEDFEQYILSMKKEISIFFDKTISMLLEGFSEYDLPTDDQKRKINQVFNQHCLSEILTIRGLELIPIEIGVTIANAQDHDIQDTIQGSYQTGVVTRVILPGLRRISDQSVVRKTIVLRGNPVQGGV